MIRTVLKKSAQKLHTVLRDDGLRVTGSVCIDVVDGFADVVHDFDRALEGRVLGPQ